MPTKFKIGDFVVLQSDPRIEFPIIEVVPGDPEPRYRVFRDNRTATYFETQLRPREETTSKPRLSADGLRAYITSLHLLEPSAANLFSLRSGRVQFVPYQYRPVLRLLRADRPRLLIADEVGVGKTIEAGLIIKELRARMDISSVLVICPKALVSERKWLVEMKRFDEHFTALDGRMLRHCLSETQLEGVWPEQYSKAIVPFSVFDAHLIFGKGGSRRRKSEGLLALDPPPKFDLVIVDEAHRIRNPETYLHQAVRYFCDNAEAAIFLTATPVQLGSGDLFTLLNVLRPDLVIDRPSFEQMAEPNGSINAAVRHCRSGGEDWQGRVRACLDEVGMTEWGRRFILESPAFQDVYDQLGRDRIDDVRRVGFVRSLEELCTFSSLINRTRRRDIGGDFTTRKPSTLKIDFTPDQRRLHDDLLSLMQHILTRTHGQQNVKFMMTTIRRQVASCPHGLAPLLRDILSGKLDSLTEESNGEGDPTFVADVRADISALLKKADGIDPFDPKVNAFIKVLQDKARMANNKALVFSTFRHTLTYIARHTANAGLRFGLVHGGVEDEERSELRRRFALPKEDRDALDVLLSSEVGGEGLDFQFCDLLVNYDLPWNPMRIEQRIGRIDRYGQQSETVAVVNLVTPGTVDADIYERCLCRIGVFRHAVGGSEEILGEIAREIRDIADNFTLSPEERAKQLEQLGDNKIRQIQEESALEERQAELFGLTVPNSSWHDEVADADSIWLSPKALQCCVSAYLSSVTDTATGFLLGGAPLKSLRLNRAIRAKLLEDFNHHGRVTDPVARQWERWLKGAVPRLSVTFDQEIASAEPHAVHLDVLHPLVRQAARHQERSGVAHVGLVAYSDTLPADKCKFALYHWRKVGVRDDDTIVAIASDAKLDAHVMPLLADAEDAAPGTTTVDGQRLEDLDKRHYRIWSTARAKHIADNQRVVQRRLQSLKVSHQARCNVLQDQIDRATNERIFRMKESELARAKLDYERRAAGMKEAEERADINATLVAIGVLQISGNGA